MRVISGILFCSIILFSLAGLPVVFKCQQLRIRREIKNQIKEGIPKEELQKLSFSREQAKDLQWTKNGKEFLFENEMYDVVSSSEEGGTIHYYCINDKEEKSLVERLNEMVAQKLKDDFRSDNNLAGKLIRAISSLVYLYSDTGPSIASFQNKIFHFSRFNCHLSIPYLEYDTPPPKLA